MSRLFSLQCFSMCLLRKLQTSRLFSLQCFSICLLRNGRGMITFRGFHVVQPYSLIFGLLLDFTACANSALSNIVLSGSGSGPSSTPCIQLSHVSSLLSLGSSPQPSFASHNVGMFYDQRLLSLQKTPHSGFVRFFLVILLRFRMLPGRW